MIMKEVKIEMRAFPTFLQFRPLGTGHSPEVWKIVTGREQPPFDWSGCCCNIEAVTATIERITTELQEIGFTPVFIP